MQPDTPHALIAALATLLEQGLPQDAATAHCIESMCGTFEPETLARLVDDDGNAEAATIRELLLFPTQEAMRALEPVMEATRCTQDDAAAVCAALAALPAASGGHTSALFPDGTRLPLALTMGDLESFVARLRPTNHPPQELAAIIDARMPPDLAVELKVLLRHGRLEWTPSRLFFLTTFLRRATPTPAANPDIPDTADTAVSPGMPDAPEAAANPDAPGASGAVGAANSQPDAGPAHTQVTPGPAALLRYALELLDISDPNAPPRFLLHSRHEALAGQIKAAEQFEEMRTKSNFETMIMQGARIAQPHIPTLRGELALLDALCRAMFDRSAAALAATPTPLHERDMGDFQDAASLMDAWSTFSD
ncbi:MAG: hypothetical protein AB7E47_07460 [Desulfovibrionaceae bacterium]